jgi:hypothetical protein
MSTLQTVTAKLPSTDKIPSPVFALVGVTDLATAKAKELNEKLAAMDRPTSDDAKAKFGQARDSVRSIDLTKVDPRKVRDAELPKVPKVDVKNVELPKVELSDATAFALELAAVVEKKYDELVVRGERVVAELRGEEHVTAPVADDSTASPAAPAATTTKTAKAATKPVKKAAKQPTETVTKDTSASASDSGEHPEA